MSLATPGQAPGTDWKSFLFRRLESASEWLAVRRGRSVAARAPQAATTPDARSVWLFVSTIGELNAVEPFVQLLLAELGHPPLTLITDRSHYGPAYLAKFPQAQVETLSGTAPEVTSLALRRPPLLLLVAEIPCMLHDAPCRFSYRTVQAARQAGAPVALVNGWLYGYPPPSRLDAIEQRLFARDYLQAFDLMMVQTTDVRDRLVQGGARPGAVVVTGNIKFDAMRPAFAMPADAPLRDALRARRPGPVVVAGSVTQAEDLQAVVEGFAELVAQAPDALLILAPRHPENPQVMAGLARLLDASGLDWRLRSAHAPDSAVAGSVMVLDTMGELRSCYAQATLAYVGTDHSVLEPLAFGKPVFVSDGWEPTYPSYPVYRQLLEAGALHAVGPVKGLGAAWRAHLAAAEGGAPAGPGVAEILQQVQGAAERSLQAMREHGLVARRA
jgi:3-deoxy-D-manno-octulosonic-acid transferase